MFRKPAIFVLIMILSLLMTASALAAPFSSSTLVAAGNVSGVWNAAGSPYLIDGDITIPAGATFNHRAWA